MSKPRYRWWGYIRAIIRAYPELSKQHAALMSQSVTVGYSGMPGSSMPSRTTETLALREMPHQAQKEYDAVRCAIELTQQWKGGDKRMQIIRLVYWDKSHTLAGAAMTIKGCSTITAKRWHGDFIRLVAKFMEMVD